MIALQHSFVTPLLLLLAYFANCSDFLRNINVKAKRYIGSKHTGSALEMFWRTHYCGDNMNPKSIIS